MKEQSHTGRSSFYCYMVMPHTTKRSMGVVGQRGIQYPLMTHLSVTLRDSLAMPRILRILCLSVIECVSPSHVLYNHSSLINHQQL